MKKSILFCILIQVIILLISTYLYFDNNIYKFLISILFIYVIYIPTLLNYFFKYKINYVANYFISIISLILFLIFIVQMYLKI